MEVFRFVFSPIDENTYVLADQTGDCAVIDCGCYDRDEFSQLTDLMEKKKLNPVLLLNTHCHLDHIFGNGYMGEKYKLGPYYHKEDDYNRESAVHHSMFFGLTMDPPPRAAGFIVDGQEIRFGNSRLKVLFVPGHSAGGVSFWCEEENIVFTGDTLFRGSIGRTDLPGGNYETIIASIKKQLFVLPVETVVYAGHGDPTTIGEEIRYNPYFQDR